MPAWFRYGSPYLRVYSTSARAYLFAHFLRAKAGIFSNSPFIRASRFLRPQPWMCFSRSYDSAIEENSAANTHFASKRGAVYFAPWSDYAVLIEPLYSWLIRRHRNHLSTYLHPLFFDQDSIFFENGALTQDAACTVEIIQRC